MTTKEQFLKDTNLSSGWRTVAGGDNFQKVLTYARSHIAEQGPSREELRGAELMAFTLLTLSEVEEPNFEWPRTGLDHQAERMPEKPQPLKEKKSK